MAQTTDTEAQHIFENHVRSGRELAARIAGDPRFAGLQAAGHIGTTYTVTEDVSGRRVLVDGNRTVYSGPHADATEHDYFELSHSRGAVMRGFQRQAHAFGAPHLPHVFATARGRRAARHDAAEAARLGVTHVPGTDVEQMPYPRTQSPVGLYGEVTPVMVRGAVAYNAVAEPPTVTGGNSAYFAQTWQPGMLSWSDHRPATRADYREYLRTVHPQVARGLAQARTEAAQLG